MVNLNVRSRIVIALNECGKRVGESHHNAWIPDVIVDLIRYGHEDYGWGYLKLAAMFGLSKNTVRKLCTYERRAQTPARWVTRKVRVDG
jgi:hypothetical protein